MYFFGCDSQCLSLKVAPFDQVSILSLFLSSSGFSFSGGCIYIYIYIFIILCQMMDAIVVHKRWQIVVVFVKYFFMVLFWYCKQNPFGSLNHKGT